MGPIELIVIEFRGNHFKGEIIPALKDLVDKNLIHIIDLTFIKKDREGDISLFEMSDLDDETAGLFEPIITDVNGMISLDDIQRVSGSMHKNSSVGMLVIEYVWAQSLREAIVSAKGRLVFDTLVPVEAAEKARIKAMAGQS